MLFRSFLVEAFPKHVRCSGLSVGYNLAQSVLGGTVPMVAVYLTKVTGDPLAPAFYLSLAGVVSLNGAMPRVHRPLLRWPSRNGM